MATRIVHIDNDDRIRDLFKEYLTGEGWQVLSYPYTHVNPTAVKSIQPDLIILDFNLEDDGIGWPFLQLLKMDDATAKIPILITTTTMRLPVEVQDYLRTRYITVIRKPYDPDTLLSRIHKTLHEASEVSLVAPLDRTLPILLVDDTDDLRDNTATVLRLEGYRVVTAYNGEVALDTVSSADYCLILLDIAMPVMDGYEFLNAYAQQLRPHIPVIIISGERDIGAKNLPPFVVHVLAKPFAISHLLEHVEKYAEAVEGRART